MEITTTYSVEENSEKRLKELKEKYGFDCKCGHCWVTLNDLLKFHSLYNISCIEFKNRVICLRQWGSLILVIGWGLSCPRMNFLKRLENREKYILILDYATADFTGIETNQITSFLKSVSRKFYYFFAIFWTWVYWNKLFLVWQKFVIQKIIIGWKE